MSQNKSSSYDHVFCVIPVYNNKATIKNVALESRSILKNVIVVDDGSTDVNIGELFKETDIVVLKHEKNQGKGRAILTALKYLKEKNAQFMITIDADGQHYPRDIKKFLEILPEASDAIVVGVRQFTGEHVPSRSKFGRALSNFWFHVETGLDLGDCQSGFRCYPVEYVNKIKLNGQGYDFETEIITRGAWAGLLIKTVNIDVYYPPEKERVSHFHPFLDNFRISLMHTRLVGRRLLPIPYPAVIKRKSNINLEVLKNPAKFLKMLLKENVTPAELAMAAGVGVLLGTLPIMSMHILVTVYFSARLHLNKIMALGAQAICMPPFIPVACIELGHYMLYRNWLTEVSWNAIFGNIPQRLFEWLLGSLILAPIFGVISGVIVYFLARRIKVKNG